MMPSLCKVWIVIAAVIQTLVLRVEGQPCIDGEIDLERGSGPWEGHVMVCSNGIWGAVCDNGWGMSDAIVTCRQLGYNTELGVDYYLNSYFGYRQLDTPTVLSGVGCVGNEKSLAECSAVERLGSTDVQYCDPGHMAGVFCGYGKTCSNGELRFTSSKCFSNSWIHCKSGRSAGRLEYCKDGVWTYICSYPRYTWSINEAEVACKQLGFVSNKVDTVYSNGGGFLSTLEASNVHCNTGSEKSITECLLTTTDCPSQYNSAGAMCYSYGGSSEECSEGDIRLFSAFADTPANEGILQTCSGDHTWHSVCYDAIPSNYIAKTACTQLGYRGALAIRHNGGFYYGYTEHNDPLVYSCNATDTTLAQCRHFEHKYPICGTMYSSMGLVCYKGGTECTNGDVRLVSTDTGLSSGVNGEGRVEYCYDNMWSPVCNLSSVTAEMMCQKMGYNSSQMYSVLSSDKRSNEKSLFNYINCGSGATEQLSDCDEVSKDVKYFMADTACVQEYSLKCLNVTHDNATYQGIGSSCTDKSLKLINPDSTKSDSLEGVLVICHHKNLVSLSTDGWTESHTKAACMDLTGYYDGSMYSTVSSLRSATYLHNINCTKNSEHKLSDCSVILTVSNDTGLNAVGLRCTDGRSSMASIIATSVVLPVFVIITTTIAVVVLIVVVMMRQSARAVRINRKQQQMEDTIHSLHEDRVSVASMLGDNDKLHLLHEENLW